MRAPQLLQGFQAIQLRHLHIQGHRVGRELVEHRQRYAAIGGNPHDLQLRIAGENFPQELPDHHRIIDNQYARGHQAIPRPIICNLSRITSRVKGFITYSSAP